MQDVYRNIDEYNTDKERKILIGFDDMIADMINNKRLYSIVTDLFIRGRKLNISLVFVTQSYFKVPKDVRLNSTHFFIMKIPNKRELQQIALNHSSDINFKDFIKIYKKCTSKLYSFSVNDLLLASYKIKSSPLMITLKMKNCNIISTEKPLKYRLYHQAKLISMNILLLGKYYHQINNK